MCRRQFIYNLRGRSCCSSGMSTGYNRHCELLKDNSLKPCDINSNQCNSSANFSSSYSLQCEIICQNTHITVRTRKFYFHFNSLPVCNLTGMLLTSCMHATLYCLRVSLLVIFILVILAT